MKNKDIEPKEKNNCIRVCIRVRPLLEHEDVEFWQVDKDKNIIYTDNYYSTCCDPVNSSLQSSQKSEIEYLNKLCE